MEIIPVGSITYFPCMPDTHGFIEGIFNYCDAWCERCGFTSRCRNFALQREYAQSRPPGADPLVRFWQEVNRDLCAAPLIDDGDTASGEPVPEDSCDALADELKRLSAQNHECVRDAKTYARMVEEWFKASLPESSKGGVHPEHNPLVKDAIKIVRWYQYFIYVKLCRAVNRLQDENTDDQQCSAYGSVKIALIGLDRSITAWDILHKALPDCATGIASIIAYGAGLRRRIEEGFPLARGFKRPGFDT
ncbi:MAG: hypothetical protein JW768_16270 [Chitinispirillaceae bacterium]|nr:hypothetical protein [Chitinispirillaceae bacterium]